MRKTRRFNLASQFLAAALFAGASWAVSAQEVTVYKSPTCGCCGGWVEHMKAAGFKVKTIDQADVQPMKTKLGVPMKMNSCHTAVVEGYVIEGHVPGSDVRRLLKEKPKVKGLAAPGMPPGSPGMDLPNSPPYDVIAFDGKGGEQVYSRHTPK